MDRLLVGVAVLLAGICLSIAVAASQEQSSVTPAVPCATTAPAALPMSAPTASAAPAPSPLPLRLSPSALQLNAGMCARLVVSGGVPPYSAASANGSTVAVADGPGSFLFRGIADGSDTTTIGDASGSKIDLPVLVAPDAGALPPQVSLVVTGSVPPSPSFLADALATQLARESQLRPGSGVTGIDESALPSTLSSAAPWSGNVWAELTGAGQWRNVAGNVFVRIAYASQPQLDPAELYLSDDPEKVSSSQNGVLFRQTLQSGAAARVFAYAQLQSAGLAIYLAVESPQTSQIQVLGGKAGPGDYDDAGHKATVRYLEARRLQQSVVTNVSASDPFLLALGQQASTQANQVVAGIYDVRVLNGAPADVIVVAASTTGDPRGFLQQAAQTAFEDAHFRAGVYPLDAEGPLTLSSSSGLAPQFQQPSEGTAVLVGTWAVPPVAGKRDLIGDFGVVRSLRITLTNVGAQTAAAYLYEIPTTAGDTTTVFFDDQPAPIELPCLKTVQQERYLIRAFSVPPGGAPLVATGTFMTDGGSAYPMTMGVSWIAPLNPPPKANCFPPKG